MGAVERFERLELKYHITERLAERIRRMIGPWCVPDSYNGQGGYPISSLYLDTPTLAFHRARDRGDIDRFKLRIRTYGEKSPAFLEIKRKTGKIVRKERSTIPRQSVQETMEMHGSDASQGAEKFLSSMLRCGAEPKLTVFYRREAYTSTVDNYARVTFDRGIQSKPALASDWTLHSLAKGQGWHMLDRSGYLRDAVSSSVILELKCETFMPMWMNNIIRGLDLVTTGFSKYSNGIDACSVGASQAFPTLRF